MRNLLVRQSLIQNVTQLSVFSKFLSSFCFASINNHNLWAACCFLFIRRLTCAGYPSSRNFVKHAGNCQTMGLDDSAHYPQLSAAHQCLSYFFTRLNSTL